MKNATSVAPSRRPLERRDPQKGELQADLAYERLREAIIALALRPGEMYSEADLAEFVGLGRTPVRDALHRLTREELVISRRNRGIFVTPIDVIRQLQLLDVRRALEQLLATRACEQATSSERREMLELAEASEKAITGGDSDAFLEVNRQVQELKARAAHNESLKNTLDLFYGLSRRFWVAYHARLPDSLATAGNLHARILRAIATSNKEEAVKASNELMDYLESFTRQSLELRVSI